MQVPVMHRQQQNALLDDVDERVVMDAWMDVQQRWYKFWLIILLRSTIKTKTVTANSSSSSSSSSSKEQFHTHVVVITRTTKKTKSDDS